MQSDRSSHSDSAVTFRHLYSRSLGVRDPLRVVALCDLDAFFASCEQVRLGIDPEQPLVVIQWNLIVAVNHAARKFGVQRWARPKVCLNIPIRILGQRIQEAKVLCPNLIIVHVATFREGDKEPMYRDVVDGSKDKVCLLQNRAQLANTTKISLELYRRESSKILSVLKEITPSAEVGNRQSYFLQLSYKLSPPS